MEGVLSLFGHGEDSLCQVQSNRNRRHMRKWLKTSMLTLISCLQEVAVRRTGTSHCYSAFCVFLIWYTADGLCLIPSTGTRGTYRCQSHHVLCCQGWLVAGWIQFSSTHVLRPSTPSWLIPPITLLRTRNMIYDRTRALYIMFIVLMQTRMSQPLKLFHNGKKELMQIFDSQNWFVTASDQTGGRINIITIAVIMSAAFAGNHCKTTRSLLTILFIFDDCSEKIARCTMTETKALLFLFWKPNMTLVSMVITLIHYSNEYFPKDILVSPQVQK